MSARTPGEVWSVFELLSLSLETGNSRLRAEAALGVKVHTQ